MTGPKFLLTASLLAVLAGAAQAQGFKDRGPGFDRGPAPQQGFNTDDEMPGTSHDPRYYRQYDPRYSQTYQQQQAEPASPRGGCLKYGAIGAAGGYAAGHPVLGALAGCVAGRVVRDRDLSQEQNRR
ncbi:MAG: hypothetical protein NVSMB18_17420 [Acetobacteraceae bacterium]